MVKNDARGDTPQPTNAPSAQAANASAALDAKLAPLDEFRARAESWMKEITAQVARLAGRSEEEERRKTATDKRLADLEDRMQSLLTLTEMVSLSKNPFAGPRKEAPAATNGHGTPAPVQPVAALAPPAGNGHHADATAPAQAAVVAPPAPERPVVIAPPAPEPIARPAPRAAHPNDARAEARAPEPRVARLAVADTFPARREPASATPRGFSSGRAEERFFVLEWARLLAPSALRIDLSGFLGFYVEAGWVSPELAGTVRNLALQLWRDSKEGGPLPLDELHARSILLVSRLYCAAPPLADARLALQEAREAANGAWAAIQR